MCYDNRIQSHDCTKNTSLYTSQHETTCSCSCWKYLEQSNVNMPSFLYFFSQVLMHRYTHSNTPTHTHSQNAFTTSMPCDLARHYANSQTCHLPEISETKWESVAVRVCERDSAHLSICESVLSSVTTVHRQGTWNLVLQLSAIVWGQSVLRKKKKRSDTWPWRANVELFCGTCYVYCSLSKFLEAFLAACKDSGKLKWIKSKEDLKIVLCLHISTHCCGE